MVPVGLDVKGDSAGKDNGDDVGGQNTGKKNGHDV